MVKQSKETRRSIDQRSVEEQYQKKTLHEHVLQRPDSYVGINLLQILVELWYEFIISRTL